VYTKKDIEGKKLFSEREGGGGGFRKKDAGKRPFLRGKMGTPKKKYEGIR